MSNIQLQGPKAEWHKIKKVLVHTPTDDELLWGVLYPEAALFECSFAPDMAAKEHKNFISKLEAPDTIVYNLLDVLVADPNALKALAKESITYNDNSTLAEQDNRKDKVLSKLGPKALLKIISTQPTINVTFTDTDTGMLGHYSPTPLMNLFFMRDQSINTCKGAVIGKMHSAQRYKEVPLVKLAYKNLDRKILCEITGAGRLEGGDFIPAGEVDFIGQGLRTNQEGIRQLMACKAFCAERVIVVKDSWHNQIQMHLDTYFNIMAPNKAVLVETRIGKDSTDPMFLHADIYRWYGDGYFLTVENIDFVDFLRTNLSYRIIPVPAEDQLKYGVNFITVSENNVIAVDGVSDQYKQALSDAGINATWMDFKNLTCGYGAAHCMTQVIHREDEAIGGMYHQYDEV